ncbi:MAG: peptidoglycan DD-metalloendopeptidase family protein [Myxococcota bacterium]
MKRATRAMGVGLAVLVVATSLGAETDLERLRGAIDASRDRVAAFESEERGLLEAIEAIDESAELLRVEARRAKQQAQDMQEALGAAESNAADVLARLAKLEASLSSRAVALYRAGELGAVRMLFGSRDLEQFFSRVQTLRFLVEHDSALIAAHREESRALLEARRRVAEASEDARLAEETLAERTAALATERERKRELARQLSRNRALERSALGELEVAARALEETVSAWGERTQAAVPVVDGPAFTSLAGKLPDPVRGKLAGRFGKVVDRASRTATFRKGVRWSAARGTPVHAVAAGRVRFAGRFRGYGNVVILDHGEDHFTVSAHLDEVAVGLGENVAARERIGAVGDSGSLDGTQLYFEVRRGAEALDPASWLRALGGRRAKR